MLKLRAEFPIQWELSYAKGIQSLSSDMKERIQNIENEVQFLVMYRHCLSNLDDPPFGKQKFAEILRCSDATLKKQKQRRTFDEALQEVNSWETLCSEMVQEIHSYKKSIWEDFLVFFDCSYYCSFSVMKLLKLIMNVVVLLPMMNDKLQLQLKSLKKKPINGDLELQSLQKKLQLFGRILALYSEHCIGEFKIRELQGKNIGGALGEWVWTAASLFLLNWALDEKDAKIATKLNEYLSRSNRKFNKVLLDVTKICLSLLKDTTIPSSSSSSSDQNFKVDQLVSRFNRIQLENLRKYMTMDDIQLLCDGVILLTTFLMDLPQPEAKGYAALDRLVTLAISLDAPEMNEPKRFHFLLRDFLEMVDTIQAQGKINPIELEFQIQNDTTLGIPSLGSCEKVNNTIKQEVGDPLESNSNYNNNNVQPMMDEVVVGLECKVKDIRDKLVGGSQKLQIISIVGMPGLGKTTLAKEVFNDSSIKCHFKKSSWCTVSQSYDTKKLLLDILNDVTDEMNKSFSQLEEEDLANELRKCLRSQRYLIVMDDIWDDSVWNKIKSSFEDVNMRSRILFTSRIRDVISGSNSNVIHYPLSPLTDEECWDLLERRLFPIEKKCPINFVEVGKQIAKHCEGLPLAVVLAAGLVKEKVQNLNWWEQIRDCVSLRISKNGCAHIMELSYEHLTEPLKDCFLYLGLFQEDKLIGVQKLTKLWISEGFIQLKENEEKDLETLAKEYLSDLVNRSLLIVSRKSSNGGIKFCRVHDLLREFCLRKRKEIIFLKLLHGDGDHGTFSDNNYRELIKNAQQLRSFLASDNNNSSSSSLPLNSLHVSAGAFEPFGKEEEICSFFCNLGRHLQVLDLENVKFVGHFPEGLTKLSELRYLAIQCTHNYVPEKIEELRNLQTLIIRTEGNNCTSIFQSKLLLMENLRHVDIGKTFHRLHFRNGIQPQMKNISSFSYPCFSSGKEAKNFLRMIRGIRKLRCQFSSSYSWNSNSRRVEIDFLSNLESLNMTYVGKDVSKYEFLLPSWSLKKLTLSNFKLQWSEISRINGKLQNLEVLKLLGDSVRGEEWSVEEDEKFAKLKLLKLRGLKIERWDASAENFPFLEGIVVEQCHKLEGIPLTFVEISTLKMIQVRRCRYSVLRSAREIRREQIENGNEDFQLLSMQILEQKFFG